MRNRIVVAVGRGLEGQVLPTLQSYAVTPLVRDPEALLARIDPGRTVGVVLSDAVGGAPLAALRPLRECHPLLPVSCLVAAPCPSVLRALGLLDVECMCVPLSTPVLHRFAQRSLVFGALPDEAVAGWVSRLAQSRDLAPVETQLLCMALANESRARMRTTLGMCENTLKGHVRTLLRKTGERSLDGLAKNVLRVALLEARPGRRDIYRAPWLARGAAA